ncbi:plasminogen-like [Branchiostoma floridae]|uniref:Plasminogen-like n=1 Tax=Branchiostoma floridae TaxID=7739 RepID=A0A9J7NCM1_BRAFL|nr:plasminogen-like [Branchiostoma floridae]
MSTVVFVVLLFCVGCAAYGLDCLEGDGSSYRGDVSVTSSGIPCQKWHSQTPHSHLFLPQIHPDSGLTENYCRNPADDVRPWCLTTDPDVRWEYCDVPGCENTTEPSVERPTRQPCRTGESCMYCPGASTGGVTYCCPCCPNDATLHFDAVSEKCYCESSGELCPELPVSTSQPQTPKRGDVPIIPRTRFHVPANAAISGIAAVPVLTASVLVATLPRLL